MKERLVTIKTYEGNGVTIDFYSVDSNITSLYINQMCHDGRYLHFEITNPVAVEELFNAIENLKGKL